MAEERRVFNLNVSQRIMLLSPFYITKNSSGLQKVLCRRRKLFILERKIYGRRENKYKKYVVPANVKKAAKLFELLRNRGIFVDLLSDQEVCNMTAATFSRDDILRYQGEERGIKQGQKQATILDIQNMLEFGVPEEKILQKYSREDLDEALEGMSVGV